MFVQDDELLPALLRQLLQSCDEVRLLEDVMFQVEPPKLIERNLAAEHESAGAPLQQPHAPVLAFPSELEPPRPVDNPDCAAAADVGISIENRHDVGDQFRWR